MKITYSLESDDLFQFNKYYLKNSKHHKRFQLIVLPLIALLFYIMLMIPTEDKSIAVFIGNFIFVLIFLLAAFLFNKLFMPLYLKFYVKVISKEKNKNMLGECEITTTDEAIIENINGNESKFLWKNLHSINESDKYFYIYIGTNAAIIVPIFRIDPTIFKDFKDEVLKLFNAHNK